MNKLRLQILLMTLTILGVAGFQAFWLRQTYNQEKRTLAIKTDLAFREAIQQLQVEKLKLDSIPADSLGIRRVKVFAAEGFEEQQMDVHLTDKKGMFSTINVIRKRVGDSMVENPRLNKALFLTRKNGHVDTAFNFDESAPRSVIARNMTNAKKDPNGNKLFQLLYGVDSLQDSLRLSEIDTALQKNLVRHNIVIPFLVKHSVANRGYAEAELNEVTVGFVNPVTYKFVAGNIVPYLLKRISLPLLFSFLLFAITLISFLLLYRNLLQQRRLTAIKNEFIGNITHELKTPIATVSVAIEAMKNFNALQDPGRTTEYLGIAGQELNRLSLLVDKVLRLSMFENKSVELKYSPFNFAELVQEVVKSMQLQFEKCNADVSVQMNGIDFTIEADRMHLSSVVYNLLDNAIKYSKGDPVIRIVATSDIDQVTLSISDNGIGIDPAYKDKIFDKFFRVPHGDMHNVKGYGLGLSYAAHIIEGHKGNIEVDSNGSSGATFIIKLPRRHGN